MINCDLPWNPNRLEQRFGRIHRIGQTEVCHLWNLLAEETREGDVYIRLLEKIEKEREALGGSDAIRPTSQAAAPAAGKPSTSGRNSKPGAVFFASVWGNVLDFDDHRLGSRSEAGF
jgi:hypothetical protein